MKISAEWRRLHLAAMEVMLAVERRTLADLRRIEREVMALHQRSARRNAPDAIRAAANDLERRFRVALSQARTKSRIASHESLSREFELALEHLAKRGVPMPADGIRTTNSQDLDRYHAARAAKSYADAWNQDAIAAESDPLKRAAAGRRNQVELIATTEVAESFGNEREASTNEFAERNRELAPLLLKVWDTTLERPCAICKALDNTVRPWGIDFPNGRVPGAVHPRCRCAEVTIVAPLTWTSEES